MSDKNAMTAEAGRHKGKKKWLIAVIIIAVAVGAAAAAGFMYWYQNRDKGVLVTKENYEKIQEEVRQKVESGYFETYMNVKWTFPNGKSPSTDAVLGNSPNNTKAIRCEVILDETGEILFQTGAIGVGEQVPEIVLEKELAAGNYEATCMTYLLNENEDGTYEDSSSAGFAVNIIIEK